MTTKKKQPVSVLATLGTAQQVSVESVIKARLQKYVTAQGNKLCGDYDVDPYAAGRAEGALDLAEALGILSANQRTRIAKHFNNKFVTNGAGIASATLAVTAEK